MVLVIKLRQVRIISDVLVFHRQRKLLNVASVFDQFVAQLQIDQVFVVSTGERKPRMTVRMIVPAKVVDEFQGPGNIFPRSASLVVEIRFQRV